jgi:hypothetical protein
MTKSLVKYYEWFFDKGFITDRQADHIDIRKVRIVNYISVYLLLYIEKRSCEICKLLDILNTVDTM